MLNDKICDGCNNHEIKLDNCEMCKKDFCINCMYLFCAECKEYYSCFWCGSKFKVAYGIENINNKSFRCKKHQIELPIIEEIDVNTDKKYLKYIPEYKFETEEIEKIEENDNTIKKKFIMKTFVKIDGDWKLIKEEFVTETTIDIKFE